MVVASRRLPGGGLVTDAPPSTAERRRVTVTFSDLSGFTAMTEQLEAEDVRDVMDAIFDKAAHIIDRYGGRIASLLGDGVMAVFGDPVAHEDDAIRAVRAVIELHDAVDAMSPGVERRIGRPVQMHSGIETGMVVTSPTAFLGAVAGLLGDTVNVAARLEDLSSTGEILVGPNTYQLVANLVDVEEQGRVELKGKAVPVSVRRVVRVRMPMGERVSRQTQFVGRQHELTQLLTLVERLEAGKGGIVAVEGDAGAGKTRLVDELRRACAGRVRWLEGRAYAFGDTTPFAPVTDLLANAVGVDLTDSTVTVADRLTAAVANLVGPESVVAIVSPLTRLLGTTWAEESFVDREVYQERLLAAVVALVDAIAAKQPTVLCVQDLQWADPSTLGLLRRLPPLVAAPVLIVVNHRPGVLLGIGEERIVVGDLTEDQVSTMLRELLDGTPSDALVNVVAARAGGNPFFVEELAHHLQEAGSVIVDNERLVAIRSAAEDGGIPLTIHGVIAARLDRLDEHRRRVLMDAAVVGREFLYRVVREVTGDPELDRALGGLVGADLVREKAPEPDLEYLFKHALTQEVAYARLVRSERRRLHGRVAAALEHLFSDRLDELTEVLAYHYREAADVQRAVPYLVRAGQRAVDRYAIDEANRHYEDAYRLTLSYDLGQERSILLGTVLNEWMLVFYYLGDFPGIVEKLEAHLPEIAAAGEPRLTGMAHAWRGWGLTNAMRFDEALADFATARGLGNDHDIPEVIAYAATWQAWAHNFMGHSAQAMLAAGAVPVAIRLEDARYVTLKRDGAVAYAHALAGRFDEADAVAKALIDLGEATSSTRARSLGYGVASMASYLRGSEAAAIANAQRAIAVANEPIYREFSRFILANIFAGFGRVEPAVVTVNACRQFAGTSGASLWEAMLEPPEAVVQLLTGQLSQGIARLVDAAKGTGLAARTAEVYLAVTYARIASRQAKAPVSALVRSPGFVVRHALPARRRARQQLEALATNLPVQGLGGFIPTIERELRRLD